MKGFPFFSTINFFSLTVLLLIISCSGVRQSVSEKDDSYYSLNDKQADKQAADREAAARKAEEDKLASKKEESQNSGGQPDYVNPEYKSSGRASTPLAPQQQTTTSQGNTIINNNYYQNSPNWNGGFGVSPYTSLGYNWIYPGYTGLSWRVSTFWGPMWAYSLYDPWDGGFGYTPYYGAFFRPYFSYYNPWIYRPFFYSPGYYGGSYWDNPQGGTGTGHSGGRVRTNLPMGGTGSGVYTSGGRGFSGGRQGGRQAVAEPSGSGIYHSDNPSVGTQPDHTTGTSNFWRRRDQDNSGYTGTIRENTQGNSNPQQTGFWRRSKEVESSSENPRVRQDYSPPARTEFSGRRSESGNTSSGWNSSAPGGRSRSFTPSSGSGNRRR